ncbi:PH domain-containing protein [Curtobacterium sp. YR515]|uniref:PH domain-containing protein n=1 Tax=Curtobacterium sp. YR515 TaxID=1855316 RepID=UPI0008ED768C|nr:PH domain-containing protein [Curtobacterium sp. YR515]SFF38442.1 PH domain-containing protein [Curtobacterium sp. YR515]
MLGDAAVRGSWDVVLHAVGPLAALVWVLWVLTFRPHVRITDHAITVVNPLRSTTVPWGAVEDVRMRWQIVLDLADGRRLTCWGGPSLPRPKPTRRGEPRVLRQPDEFVAVRDRWSERHGRTPDAPVVRGWDVPAVASGIAVFALCVVAIVV